ncbi:MULTISPECIES: cytochrome P450 [Streptomycetaceae]|uniref:Cytochrome P450 n=1 Tax=Streptantibioticus cattleyicolor (strain ATCC 35852 / DSM 46488 / JCM 4925 / NBRC 14057 / NRRL 8057) TaxID=1003195 RepID=F8JTY8_STREN|nr:MULTISPECIES: cytochrome P450 [Streptomycetaceae]AEW98085.1 cytochrome P450 [Streptantibioticus cattleyicolor NRRL 8057 = DSM 46488]MYS62479.1 cytochrome P450 [Streptomyces sp. SID5468]CCB78401.1 Cytochrome P450 105C1 [Streptantibioticus cattleyicolor NRRL 8057 = DSM 46488]
MSQALPIPEGLPAERDAGPFDPPRGITRMREARPVMPLIFPDGHEGWLVTGYDAVRQVMADTRFSSRLDIGIVHVPYQTPGMPAPTEPSPQIPGMFIAMDPPDHTRLRRKLTGAFTVKRMKMLEEHIIDITERQLDALARLTPPVDLVKEFALPVPSLVICELLGVPYEDRETFQSNSAQFLVKDQTVEEKVGAYNALTTYLAELVTRKRAEPGDDILSDLARHDDLTIEELTGIAFLLLLAGHETTANMLALGTFALLENPGQLAELRADPGLIPDAVEELMRYLSLADVFYRYATEDIELGGETIPKGSTVVVSLLAANRDPHRFDDPDTLDIHRKARGHLSFGHGVHQCLGQQLARIEMRAGFDGLLRRFPTLHLAIPADQVKLRTDMNIYGVHELPVAWTETPR